MASKSKGPKAMRVQLHSGQEKVITMDDRPIDTQIRVCLFQFKIKAPQDESDSYVLTEAIPNSTSRIIRTPADLAEAGANRSTLVLLKASELVQDRLRDLRQVIETDSTDKTRHSRAFNGIFDAIRGEEEITVQAMNQETIQLILKALIITDDVDVESVEAAMACLCEFMQFMSAINTLAEHCDEELCPRLFRKLLHVLLSPVENKKGRIPPYCTLCFLVSILQEIDELAYVLHLAVLGIMEETEDAVPEKPNLYKQLVTVYNNTEETEDAFQALSVACLLCALTLAAETDHVTAREVKDQLDDADSNAMAEVSLWQECCDPGNLAKQNLQVSMLASTELAGTHALRRERAEALEKRAIAEKHFFYLQESQGQLKENLQRSYTSMEKLIPFVKVEGDSIIQSSLHSILRLGWDSMQFPKGYTTLHYACEYVPDPAILEMLFWFCTDPEKPDDDGLKPIDYARRSGNAGAIQTMEKLMERKAAVPVEGEAALRKRFESLTEVPPKLRSVLENVISHGGWKNVNWPEGFTALHLAAKTGHVGAIHLLIAAGGRVDLNTKDTWQRTPLEYAVEGKHLEAKQAIEKYLGETGIGPGEEKKSSGAGAEGNSHASEKPKPKPEKSEKPAEKDEVDLSKLSIPPDLHPKLHKALQTVIDRGYTKIKWPNDFTPLHLAATYGSLPAIKLLLEASARPSLTTPDARGRSPLVYAQKHGHGEEVLALLRQEVAKPAPAAEAPKAPPEVRPADKLPTGPPPKASGPGPEEGERKASDALKSVARKVMLQQKLFRAVTGKEATNADLPSEVEKGLMKDRLLGVEKGPDAMSYEELRAEVRRLKKEKEGRTAAQQAAQAGSLAHTDANSGGINWGPLSEAQLQKYIVLWERESKEAVAKKLIAAPLEGGLQLDEINAKLAMDQLELIKKFRIAAPAPTGKENLPVAVAVAVSTSAPEGGGKGKGKGKGGDVAVAVAVAIPIAEGEAIPGGSLGSKGGVVQVTAKGKGKGKEGPAAPEGPPEAAGGKGGKGKGGKGGAKGGGKSGGGPAKAKPKGPPPKNKSPVKPLKKMKGLWWGDPMILGHKVERGFTIWDEIGDEMHLLPLEELCDRFTTETDKKEKDTKPKEDKEETKEPVLKCIRVVEDSNKVLSSESALKQVPPPEQCAQAIKELDESLMPDDEHLISVEKEGCPDDGQYTQLQALVAQHKDVPLGMAEQYFMELGKIPKIKNRIQVWQFVRSAEENVGLHHSRIKDFQQMCTSLQQSAGIACLLGIVLAIGNYLNGGTNRGQADGFDVMKGLTECGNCKDKTNKELTSFVFKVFQQKMPEQLDNLIDDLGPIFLNVQRKFTKVDGADKLNKKIIVVLEDYDGIVSKLDAECKQMKTMMNEALQEITDQTDQFRLRMPAKFSKAEQLVIDLVQLREDTVESYVDMLKFFNLNIKIKTDEFCKLWDDFVMPGVKIDSFDAGIKTKFIMPYFCSDKPPTVQDLLMLWGVMEWDEKEAAKKERPGRKAGGGRPIRKRREFGKDGRVKRLMSGEIEANELAGLGGGGRGKADGKGVMAKGEQNLPSGPGSKGKDAKGVGKGPGGPGKNSGKPEDLGKGKEMVGKGGGKGEPVGKAKK